MARPTTGHKYQDIAKIIAMKQGITQEQVKEILSDYFDIIYKILISGQDVYLPNIGTLTHSKHKEVLPFEHPNPLYPKIGNPTCWSKRIPPHNTPRFKPKKSFKQEMYERTAEHPYE